MCDALGGVFAERLARRHAEHEADMRELRIILAVLNQCAPEDATYVGLVDAIEVALARHRDNEKKYAEALSTVRAAIRDAETRIEAFTKKCSRSAKAK